MLSWVRSKPATGWSTWLLLMLLAGAVAMRQQLADWSVWTIYLQAFTLQLINLLLLALPYLLLGCLLSACMHSYLRTELLVHYLRRHSAGAAVAASLLGICFPVGSRATVPLAQRLVRQGVPVGVATTFLMAAPVLNPVVLVATHQAFGGSLAAAALRAICTWLLALFLGDLVGRRYGQFAPLLPGGFYQETGQRDEWSHLPGPAGRTAPISALELLLAASDQLWLLGRQLLPGALLVAALQVLLPAGAAWAGGLVRYLAVPLALLLASLVSVCPEGDAFLVSAAGAWLGNGGSLACLLAGPLLSLQRARQLSAGFEASYLRRLFGWGALAVLFIAGVAQLLGL